MKMHETFRYTIAVAKNAKHVSLDMPKVLQVEIEAKREKIDELESYKTGMTLFVVPSSPWLSLAWNY